MKFLKENMFLVVTAAIVLVGGTVWFLVRNSRNNRADAAGKAYASVGKEISSLASSGVNQAIVNDAERRVKGMRNEAEKVVGEALLRNRRDYEVMSFKISGRTVPAFPCDPEFKDREILRLLFPEEYRLGLKDLRETLKPTVPPTDEEIDNEIARIDASAMPEEKPDQPKPTTPRPVIRRSAGAEGGGARNTGGEGGARRIAGGERSGLVRRSPGRGVKRSVVEQQALNNLIISKSEQGWIYADKEQVRASRGDMRSAAGGTSGRGAIYVALPLADYNDDSLWLAQVGLWVQQDIVAAINLTNRQVRQTASGRHSGVAASAVKRLMDIDIRGYVLRGDGDGAAALQYLDLGESKTSKPVPQLTGRACNKLYDVIHYDFTVVVPMRHLLMLQKNLMMQNYHTILANSITRPAQSDIHYYGTDSVMEVTIVGEMLMLTDWTRGRWDKQAKEWDKNYPPLTPVLFLEKMRDINAGAMRKEDNKRLPKAGVAGKTGRRRSGRRGM